MQDSKVLQLLAEPTAAALSYGFDNLKDGEDKTLLIYDFGVGTFDLSILTAAGGQFVETGAGGDRWLEVTILMLFYPTM